MLVGHQASSRCMQHFLVCGVRDCKAAKLPRIEFGKVSNVLCAPAPCDIWCVLVPARGSAQKPAVLAFICSATVQPGRAGHRKQQSSQNCRTWKAEVHRVTVKVLWLWLFPACPAVPHSLWTSPQLSGAYGGALPGWAVSAFPPTWGGQGWHWVVGSTTSHGNYDGATGLQFLWEKKRK